MFIMVNDNCILDKVIEVGGLKIIMYLKQQYPCR